MAFLAATLFFAPVAHAGTYVVNACTVNGQSVDNRSWTLDGPVPPGITADLSCPTAGDPIGLTVAAGARTPDATDVRLVFNAPPGTTIADFRLDRRFTFRNPEGDGTHRYFTYYGFGGDPVGGSGNYLDATRDALHAVDSWYGYPAANADLGRGVVTKASFPWIASHPGSANRIVLRLGCFRRGTPCHVAAGGSILNQVFGAQVTLTDTTAPALTVNADGLLSGGQRSGSDPVRLSASDNSGIRRVDLLDVTGGGQTVVGSEDYADGGTHTDKGATCSSRLAHQCPNLAAETVRPTSLTVGSRQLIVRVTDTAGNVTQRGPYTVDVGTPSDRGAFNGANATDDATLTAAFYNGAIRRTIDYGQRPTVSGRLVNSAGAPISGAQLVVITKDSSSDRYVERGRLVTDADGRYAFKASGAASRLIQVGWRSHVNDTRFTENAYVTTRVHARGSLHAPKRVSLFHRFTLSGRLYGKTPPGRVTIVAQGAAGHGRYRTFADGKTSRSGRFKVSYRFRDPHSRGRTFRLRVKILQRNGWPYLDGRTRTVRVRVR